MLAFLGVGGALGLFLLFLVIVILILAVIYFVTRIRGPF